MKKLFFSLAVLVIVFSLAGCDAAASLLGDDFEVWEREDPDKWAGVRTGKWTVMVWLDGDNDLEAAAVVDLNEMEEGLYYASQGNTDINDELSIIVQIDRAPGYLSGGYDGSVDWKNPRRYRVTADDNTSDHVIRSYQLANMAELSMGSASNLKDFITYCKTNYPAENYALILWNHGGGVKSYISGTAPVTSISKSASLGPVSDHKAICWDETDNDDCLYVGEITDVLTNSESVDLLGFDACLMGMAEVAYEYRPDILEPSKFSADYMAASVATEQGDGWEYERIFKRFKGSAYYDGDPTDADPCYDAASITGRTFAQIVVEEYKDEFKGDTGETMAAYDLSAIAAVKTALDNLASTLNSADGKTTSETARDDSLYFFNKIKDAEWLGNPHFDLYDYAVRMGDVPLQSAVSSCVISSWGEGYSGYTNDDITDNNNGLGFFYPNGDEIYNDYPHYAYQWWYSKTKFISQYGYGELDFCDFDNDGSVETWKELLEFWFDNEGDNLTPDSF